MPSKSGQEPMDRKLTDSKSEPTAIILINGHNIKLHSAFAYLLMQLSDIIREVSLCSSCRDSHLAKCREKFLWSAQPQMGHLYHPPRVQGSQAMVEEETKARGQEGKK